jgi:sterol desaturase/sphingolipid hydroxylase (fatty acid hydroxylase superfamily)
MLIGHFLTFGLTAWGTAVAFEAVTGKPLVETILRESNAFSGADLAITLGYMLVSAVVIDLTGFFIHHLQHKLPILWEFHKVHHSAEVMHPVSNYREHPVDNIFYKTATGLGAGAAAGVAVGLFGYTPSVPSLLGVPVIMFCFNMLAYNLRHSHIWLRWPGAWAMILPSPAHHHVHHSCHPNHIDKNFAFIFPVWDVIFGTYCMPADNRDVKFGIGEDKAAELTSCLRLYFVPFRDAWRLVRDGLRQSSRPREAAASSDLADLASAVMSR